MIEAMLCVDTPAASVHLFAMHHASRINIAARRRRRTSTGVGSLRVL
jgi:hypothetical protein